LVHQDARIYLATIEKGRQVEHQLAAERHAWLQVLRGSVIANGHDMDAGDGAAVSEERLLAIQAPDGSAEVMLFDLA
jgi:redox-sensitive bicupin YhaK (pirin superfamily)